MSLKKKVLRQMILKSVGRFLRRAGFYISIFRILMLCRLIKMMAQLKTTGFICMEKKENCRLKEAVSPYRLKSVISRFGFAPANIRMADWQRYLFIFFKKKRGAS